MIYIIGIGYMPLDKKAEALIQGADSIVASQRLLEVFRSYPQFASVQHKLLVIRSVDETIEFLRSNINRPTVLLASGDPMFHGIGRRVIKEIGSEMVHITPELSCIQCAFSMVKEPWDDAFLMSLHGGLINAKHNSYVLEDVPILTQKYRKIAILTDSKSNPRAIAESLRDTPNSEDMTIHVCQRIGYDDECVASGNPALISGLDYKEPNVVIVINPNITSDLRHKEHNILFGLSEHGIVHKKGLITKDEVRAVIIHMLRLPRKGIFWDIGAGSGSVSLEIANMLPEMRIYAVEKDTEQQGLINHNITHLGINNITLISGNAPESLNDLPSPDRVFIGGSSGRLRDMVDIIKEKSSGRAIIVLAASMIETLHDALSCFKESGFEVYCSQVSISRMNQLSRGNYLKASNPVFVIRAEPKNLITRGPYSATPLG